MRSAREREGLARLIERLEPGGRLLRTRRLRGGLGARMDVVTIERADGTLRNLSLRRFINNSSYTPEKTALKYRKLQFVEGTGIPAPRPLLLDAHGELFGVPAIVLTYLPGAPIYNPREVPSWAAELARALHVIHAVTPDRFDMSWMTVMLRDGMRAEIERRRAGAEWALADAPALAHEVHAVLDQRLDTIEWLPPSLVHDDFWPGNAIWYRGRLTGIIDWSDTELGDPRADVSECRIALALEPAGGSEGLLLDAYEAQAARSLPDIWYFDLFRGLRALLHYKLWLVGYQDAGVEHLTPPVMRRRIEAFLRRALAQA